MRLGKKQREESVCEHKVPLTAYCEDCVREGRELGIPPPIPQTAGYQEVIKNAAVSALRSLSINLRVVEYDGKLWVLLLTETLRKPDGRWVILLGLARLGDDGNTIENVEMEQLEFNKLLPTLPLVTFTASV